MALLLVSYDLGANSDCSPLVEELKRTKGWWHYLESTWILSTQETPNQVWNRVVPHLHKTDRFLVIRIDDGARQGWLPQDAWRWIESELERGRLGT